MSCAHMQPASSPAPPGLALAQAQQAPAPVRRLLQDPGFGQQDDGDSAPAEVGMQGDSMDQMEPMSEAAMPMEDGSSSTGDNADTGDGSSFGADDGSEFADYPADDDARSTEDDASSSDPFGEEAPMELPPAGMDPDLLPPNASASNGTGAGFVEPEMLPMAADAAAVEANLTAGDGINSSLPAGLAARGVALNESMDGMGAGMEPLAGADNGTANATLEGEWLGVVSAQRPCMRLGACARPWRGRGSTRAGSPIRTKPSPGRGADAAAKHGWPCPADATMPAATVGNETANATLDGTDMAWNATEAALAGVCALWPQTCLHPAQLPRTWPPAPPAKPAPQNPPPPSYAAPPTPAGMSPEPLNATISDSVQILGVDTGLSAGTIAGICIAAVVTAGVVAAAVVYTGKNRRQEGAGAAKQYTRYQGEFGNL